MVDKLAPPLSYYDANPRKRLLFIDELINNVEFIAHAELSTFFSLKPYHNSNKNNNDKINSNSNSSSNVIEGVLDGSKKSHFWIDTLTWPAFKLGDLNVYKKRVAALESIKNRVIEQIRQSILPIYEGMFEISSTLTREDTEGDHLSPSMSDIDHCLSRKVSPLHRIDRFSNLCERIRDHMRAQLPICVEKTVLALAGHVDMDVDKYALKGLESLRNISVLLDTWTHISAILMHGQVTASLTLLYDVISESEKREGDNLWEENAEFKKDRQKLEGISNRLQTQYVRLQACVALTEAHEESSSNGSSGVTSTTISNNSLRKAVDDAAAAALKDSTDGPVPQVCDEFWKEVEVEKLSYIEERNLGPLKFPIIIFFFLNRS